MDTTASTGSLAPTLAPLTRRLRLNSAWLLLTRLITQAQLILFTVLVARHLGASGFGQYAFVAALIFLGNVATTFGTDTLVIREVARYRAAGVRRVVNGLIPAAVWLQVTLALSWLIIVGISAGAVLDQAPEVTVALQVYSLSLIPLAFFTVFTAVLRAYERLELYLLLNVSVACVQLGGAWWVLSHSGSLVALVALLTVAQVFAAVFAGVLYHLLRPALRFSWIVTRRQVWQVARLAWPFALLGVLAVVYQRLGVLLLATLGNETQAGWFAAAARVIEPVKVLHFAVLGALLPVLARLSSLPEQTSSATRVYRRSTLFLVVFSGLAAIVLIVLAQPIVTLLFGSAYTESIALVQVLALSLIPYTFSASLSVRLVTQSQERRVLWATVIGLAAAFGLNCWLIPLVGAQGAAITTLLSESLLAGTMFVLRHE